MRVRLFVLASLILLVALIAAGPAPSLAAPAPKETAATWIAFSSLAEGEEGIWVVHPDGSDLHQLTRGGDIYPTWSPDGSKLAFMRVSDPRVFYSGAGRGPYSSTVSIDIRVVDEAGNLLWTFGSNQGGQGEPTWRERDDCWLPQWSPDGQALTYATGSGFFSTALWSGRNTCYLTPSLQLAVAPEPHGNILETGGVALVDLSWAPGASPLWIRVTGGTRTYEVVAGDRTVFRNAPNAPLFNPRWSPSGQSLTVWRLDSPGAHNALVQLSAAGQVERTLFESDDLYLYNAAEWAPDGRSHLIGVSADWPAWFQEVSLKIAGSAPPVTGTTPLPLEVLPAEPPAGGYLYLLKQTGSQQPVAEPRAGTLDLISSQPWSPDGDQVVFVRIPYPGAENPPASALGIYAGPPGRTQRIVPFRAADWLALSLSYPVWQPSGENPLPTPQPPPAPVGTATPSPAPATATPAATWTIAPTATRTRTPGPSRTPAISTTVTPAAGAQPPSPPAAPTTDPTQFLIFGVLALAAAGLVFLILRRIRRRQGGALEPSAPRLSGRLLRGRRERPSREAAGLYTSRAGPAAAVEEKPPAEAPAAPGPEVAAPAPWPAEPTGRPSSGVWPEAELRARAAQLAASEAPAPAPGPEPTLPPAEPAPAPTPLPVQQMVQQGIAMVKSGRYAEALATLRQMTYLDPENAEAWLWLGWAAARTKDRAMAERCFLEAQRLGRVEQAAQALEWLEKHPPLG